MSKVPGMPGAVDLSKRQPQGKTTRVTRLQNTSLKLFTHRDINGDPVTHELHLEDRAEAHTYVFSFLEQRRPQFIELLAEAGLRVEPSHDDE